MMKGMMAGVLLIVALGLVAAAGAAPRTVVICAPGFPGDTEAARTTMEAFARAAAGAANWPEGSLNAVYHQTEQGGLERLAGDDAVLAIVPLPFFLRHGERFDLRPALQIENTTGTEEIWSLAARRGAVASPEALGGWEITGRPGYAPAFVRGPLLGAWGPLPAGVRITATASVLGALRRAAAGEQVAVLLDAAQTASLPSLPFAGDLEIVATSGRLPGGVLCTVGDRLPAAEVDSMVAGLLDLHRSPAGEEALAAMRLKRFRKLDAPALEAARRAYRAAGGGAADPAP
jgi:hypothetical protein